ncbi:hypothetical protein QNH20_16560 [Neobacillus sp. WH10]|uniref:hypothetical protein n=1 Tax=Neobacillus sp. WH10 TaxID=3047873 RepID=UPI0024C109B1|nr:hypothetical protein [Neobacillus sp. WH10]WHY75730.1 hypothetical protein QNH20_16560 [Neobacillus sp. WH10]
MTKVLLSKEEIEALESALEVNGRDKANVVQWHAQNLWEGKRAPLNDLDLDTVCTSLYVGYELEPSPEDKVLNLYKFYSDNGLAREVIEEVLESFNVQIKGINC